MNLLLQFMPPEFILAAGGLVVGLIVLFVVWAFREGREISFWPPRVGPRPESLKKKHCSAGHLMDPNWKTCPYCEAERRAFQKEDNLSSGDPRIADTSDKLAPQRASVDPRFSFQKLSTNPLGIVERIELNQFKPIRVVGRTDHSVIQTCLYNETTVVLKRTREDLCNLEALRILVHAAAEPLQDWPKSAHTIIGAPRQVWTQDGFLWELYDFYEGISLGDLVLRTGQNLNGSFLKFCAESLVKVLTALRSTGLIHSDLNPFNIILTLSGELRLIDWTFCTKPERPAVTVVTPGYTAPEQEHGIYSISSDWYSLGATLFFLGNGSAPPLRGTKEYEQGIYNLHTGALTMQFAIADRLSDSISTFCDQVLEPDPNVRAIPSLRAWRPKTRVASIGKWELFPNLRIFEIGVKNYLLLTDYGFWILPHNLEAISKMLAAGDESSGEVARLVRQYRREASKDPPA